MAHVEKDALTGTDTTGHEWDGIKELNTPLPKWWVYTFWATILWSIGYWIVYPAWPTFSTYTKGAFGYSSRGELEKELADVKQSRKVWLDKFAAQPVAAIAKDSQLVRYAMAGGRAIFNENCAPCHGAGGAGAKGYPTLADDDWLWGGTLDAIERTIRVGVRSTHAETRVNDMPKFGVDKLLTPEQIGQVADYVLSLSGKGKAGEAGKQVFAEQCAACHGEDGKGNAELGGPNLADGIWLYGSSREAVVAQINNPKQGVMPTWGGRLDDVSIKQAAIYVHSLGGGK
jgi:cytochrome c oxidase cbb3-type subunit 3